MPSYLHPRLSNAAGYIELVLEYGDFDSPSKSVAAKEIQRHWCYPLVQQLYSQHHGWSTGFEGSHGTSDVPRCIRSVTDAGEARVRKAIGNLSPTRR